MDELSRTRVLAALHNARTDRRHGGTEARADDGRHEVTAECRTGHLEIARDGMIRARKPHALGALDALLGKRRRFAQKLLVVRKIDIEVRAVCAKAGVQPRRTARREIASDRGRAEQKDLRLQLRDRVGDDLGVRVGGEGGKQRAVVNVNLVRAVGPKLRRNAVDVVAQ